MPALVIPEMEPVGLGTSRPFAAWRWPWCGNALRFPAAPPASPLRSEDVAGNFRSADDGANRVAGGRQGQGNRDRASVLGKTHGFEVGGGPLEAQAAEHGGRFGLEFGGMIRASDWPTISSARKPKRCSAARFQLVTTPSRVLPMIDLEDSTMAPSMAWASSARSRTSLSVRKDSLTRVSSAVRCSTRASSWSSARRRAACSRLSRRIAADESGAAKNAPNKGHAESGSEAGALLPGFAASGAGPLRPGPRWSGGGFWSISDLPRCVLTIWEAASDPFVLRNSMVSLSSANLARTSGSIVSSRCCWRGLSLVRLLARPISEPLGRWPGCRAVDTPRFP